MRHILRKSDIRAIIAVTAFFFAGILTGALFFAFGEISFDEAAYRAALTENARNFAESFIKYLKTAFLIWFAAFLPLGRHGGKILAAAAIAAKGTAEGFACSALIAAAGGRGLLLCLILVIPQNILTLPSYMFTVISMPAPGKLPPRYALCAALALAACVFAALIETYFSPFAINLT